jgi:hypothetical protein
MGSLPPPQLYRHIIEPTPCVLRVDQWKLKWTCLQLHDVSASKNSTTEDILKTHRYNHDCNLEQIYPLDPFTIDELSTALPVSNWQARPTYINSLLSTERPSVHNQFHTPHRQQ